MILYRIKLLPLLESLHLYVLNLVQPGYTDDLAVLGKCSYIAQALDFPQEHRSSQGYYLEPENSMLITTHNQANQATQPMDRFRLVMTTGYHYLGGSIRLRSECKDWVMPQLEKWTKAVHDLAVAASCFPQSAYVGFTKLLQSEWQYLQQMVPGVGELFTTLEMAICNKFLPSLLSSRDPPVDMKLLSTLGTHQAGLGI